jgi:2-oxoglutarate/2-oxoacid ferredoxin oxidoreductase subunit beta
MVTLDDLEGTETAWCTGCGNFGILRSFKRAAVDLGLEPSRMLIVSGIGQAGKFPHYTVCNTFNGLHGRTLPVATAARLANHEMVTIAEAGDGDCYGEGGNHFVHAMRRNVDVNLFVHDNQVYGLTKGQASPTSDLGMKTKINPEGVTAQPLDPVALAVAMDCSFVARGYAGDQDQLVELMKAAINHKGFALLDILQPCVSFNKVNTYAWYKQRCYHLEDSYDPADRVKAFERALEFGDRIPTGVLYRNERSTYEETIPALRKGPLVKQAMEPLDLEKAVALFY